MIFRLRIALTSALLLAALSISAGWSAMRPAPAREAAQQADTVAAGPKVRTTVPRFDKGTKRDEYPMDLRDPDNVRTTVEYDPTSRRYIVRTRVGEREITSPMQLTPEQYASLADYEDLFAYFRRRNAETDEQREKKPFDILDMNFDIGPLERVFGKGGVRLNMQGAVQISLGAVSNSTDNPALPLRSRRKTYFNFDQKIQANVTATVGEKLRFNMAYNTDATFQFDTKNLRLAYEGDEDEIIKSIEAGNVSMTTGSSLMRGNTSLFGMKTKLQFGKLTLTGLISQQNSEARSVSAERGVQTTRFSIKADNYDADRHFFLSQYFYDNYDTFAARLPHVSSGIRITRIEVWVTNKQANYNESRDIVGFMDLGESSRLGSGYWQPTPGATLPSNQANNLLTTIREQYPDARYINRVTQTLAPLAAFGIEGGRDFEKVESARRLNASDYTLNAELGYISLKSALQTDEVLAVAFEYTKDGTTYQVGEFSSDITATDQSLYVKMLRSTTVSPRLPMWRLMMKNIYSTGAYQLTGKNFKMQVKMLSDTTGTEITYLPIPGVSDKPLLQLMNLDRLDSNQEPNSDGLFDYIEGYTVESSTGKIIFPVAEPFGENLARKIGNPALAEPFLYRELYDSTLVVARQFADKNKYSLQGEYQSSSGARIQLGAVNVPRGSVIVTAGGVPLVENTDYTVDYAMGVVTIINQSIVESGTAINVSLENQSLFSLQRKTLLGFDAQYAITPDLNVGASVMHFSEKALTEKVNIGSELIRNTMWGVNVNYNRQFMWLTNLLNAIPTVNATAPSTFNFLGEYARLVPKSHKAGTAQGSGYIDDFESSQTGIDLRSPYSWALASAPAENGQGALFPEASLSNDATYGQNRALLAWYYIDRAWTQKNSSLLPGYMRHDLEQLSNPYVREVTMREIFPNRDVAYGEANTVQTLNLSFYPTERGPYNTDADNVDSDGSLLFPERRWGGIMRKLDNTDFQTSNVEYLQFWMLDPFLTQDINKAGGDLYFNFGDISEDILKDGMKSYENGNPVDGNSEFMTTTVWGRVSRQNSLSYAFENAAGGRLRQDLGLDGLSDADEHTFPTYSDFLSRLRSRLSAPTIEAMNQDPASPFNDPAGDNYAYYRSEYYDRVQASILDRYKRYNGVQGNSLSPDESSNPMYQSARSTPDVEDINQDNTLNEYERYFQYRVSIRPGDLEVGRNYVTDKQVSVVNTAAGPREVVWYQFKIPLSSPDKRVGGISDFSSVRFARMFLTGFQSAVHLRFATLELIRGEWRDYAFNLNNRNDAPAEGELDVSVVNIEENSARTPVNYVLPPGVSRVLDPSQSQATQLNEQSLAMKLTGLHAGDARGIYRNTQLDLRLYRRLQMWIHAEAPAVNSTDLRNGDLSLFVRVGSDVKQNYYEYEIPLTLTPPGRYNNLSSTDREKVWPAANYLDLPLDEWTALKTERNRRKSQGEDGIGFAIPFSQQQEDQPGRTLAVMGNPSLSDVRIMLIGVRNRSATTKNGEIWINELKVTDFNEKGGWAANVRANLALSDIASVSFSGHIETDGFGAVDQGMSARRLDTYKQYSVAVQGDAGRFAPPKLKLSAPVFYSRQQETTTPKYNPLDQDIPLSQALDAATTKAEKDSIRNYALSRSTLESFSLSGLRFAVESQRPMPWDPANFSASFSFSRRRDSNPTTLFENTSDYRGLFQYTYAPRFEPWRPFRRLKSQSKNAAFLREWELNWIFTSLTFTTNMSRYYYEQQARNDVDVDFKLPIQVSKNFLWDRQLAITWNVTKSLAFTYAGNTTARIEEPTGAVNKRLFPDKYREWRDTVWQSIRHGGTPWNYNQTFSGTYRAPFSRFPALSFLTGSASYTSVYRWDRGATVEDLYLGNSVQNQSTWNADARIAFDKVFSFSKRLTEIWQRFDGSANSGRQQRQAARTRSFRRGLKLSPDTSVTVRHNLHTRKLRVSATADGAPFPIETRPVDDNNLEILTRGDQSIVVNITEKSRAEGGIWQQIADVALRLAMSPRSAAFKWRATHSMSLPLFAPNVGAAFGQTRAYGPMAPGLDFAFGFFNESYIDKALSRGWLLTETQQASAAVWNKTKEFDFELNLEPLPGLRVVLTSNLTDNRTDQIQFMYAGMPTQRSGSYQRTHVALASALRRYSADDGYASAAFTRFLENIPVVAARVSSQYAGLNYPASGFLSDSPLRDTPFNPEAGDVSPTSSDVLIPAFLAAYSGTDAARIGLSHFSGLASMRPNWRVSYDGLSRIPFIARLFKTITLSHAYQCTYAIGSYTGFTSWVSAGRPDLGFIRNEQTQLPTPSSPYNISSVTITERFAPLAGIALTLHNGLTVSAEYRDTRALTLNSSAGQIVEVASQQFTVGSSYKIVGFDKILRIKGRQTTVSNDLSLSLDLSLSNNQSLIRRIETAYTQATNGTQAFALNFMASYVVSRRLTIGAFFDWQTNRPLVSSQAFPTSNANYGLSVNFSLAR